MKFEFRMSQINLKGQTVSLNFEVQEHRLNNYLGMGSVCHSRSVNLAGVASHIW